MKMRLFWLPCLMCLLGTFCAGCGSDDNEPVGEPGTGDTEMKGGYTATTAMKTVVLQSEWRWESLDIPIYYEDFNRKYGLSLCFGDLMVLPFTRQTGDWNKEIKVYSTGLQYNSFYVIMEDVGKVNNLSEITKKLSPADNTYTNPLVYPDVQPKHGYAVTFRMENDELQHLRIFITDYTLSEDGSVATVTIQYQLY